MHGGQEALLELIAAIHAGASTQADWGRALDLLSDRTGGSRLLLGTTPHAAGGFDLAGHRVDPDLLPLINGPLATREANPVFCSVPRAPIHRPVIISTKLPTKKLVKSAIYGEVLKPSGVRYTMAVVLDSDPRKALTLAMGRGNGAGDYDAEEAKLLALIAPHLCSALRLQRELGLARASAMSLDALDRGVLLASRDGGLCFANAEAERILALRDGLTSGPGGLHASRTEDSARLRRMISDAGGAALGQSFGAGGTMSIVRPSCRPPYAVRVVPAGRPLCASWGLSAPPAAVVFVRDPERRTLPSGETLRAYYGLTRAESELALCIYEGRGLSEAAACLGVSLNTAKTQLKAVFEKVGVTRQSALVRELAIAIGDLSLGQS